MKINYKIFGIMGLVGLLALGGCKRGDDFEVNPNSPTKITPAVALTAMSVSTINTYESDLVKKAMIFSQQNVGADAQMLQANEYTLAGQDYDNSWGQLYQALKTGYDIKNEYGADNPYYTGMIDVLMAMNLGMATDMWGDVPYSEALEGLDNLHPKYDSQEDVLKAVIALLDEAITKLGADADANTYLPAGDDIVYGGDPAAWTKLAYTLKARYLLRFSNKSSYDPATILTCLQNGIASESEDMVATHGGDAASENNWYDFLNNRPYYIVASEPFVDSMKLRPTDLRLYYYFDSTGLGDVVGSPVATPTTDASLWGSYLVGADPADGGDPSAPIHLVTYAEAKFIEAEVKASQEAADAADVLNDAIKASCSLVTNGAYDGSDIAIYTSSDVSVSRVLYEKWLGLFGSAEPYNDYRRTGFPSLIPNPNGHISVIPQRLPTPSTELTGNLGNAPNPGLDVPVWYATN